MRISWRHLLTMLLVLAAGLLACVPGPARAVGEGGDEPEPAPSSAAALARRPRAVPPPQGRVEGVPEVAGQEAGAAAAPRRAAERRAAGRPRSPLGRPRPLHRLAEGARRQGTPADRVGPRHRPKKLEVIRELREREWVSHLAQAERERIEQAAPEERTQLIETLRRRSARTASRVADGPASGERCTAAQGRPDLWPQVRLYEEKSLIPTLTHTERDELAKAVHTSWPEHAQKLIALAQKHPIQVPPSETVGVTPSRIFPDGYVQQLLGKHAPKEPRDGDTIGSATCKDRWPNFALEVDHLARNRKVPLPDRPLGPCKPDEFVQGSARLSSTTLRKDPPPPRKTVERCAG